ncbi:glycosyltransferase family 4 protein [Lichenicola sp.]|uniref:glycosyltransferase family 4 protein n=1 Tax=Lichenicola sp. TaxID=2804529 RepID=UPI003B003BA2
MTIVPNAALLYHASGFSTAGQQLMGINAASEGLLRGLARYAGVDLLTALVGSMADGEHFRQAVQAANPLQATRLIPRQALGELASVGALMLSSPGLGDHAWQRRALGAASYSLVGITHTTATPRVMDALAAYATAPVEPWDALVCTSQAVRAMVFRLLDDQDDYLRERLALGTGARLPRPQLPVIPLGIDCDAFTQDPAHRADWRSRLGVGENDVVALFLGRLSHHQKAHPIPLFQALQQASAQQAPGQRLMLVMAGWFGNPTIEAGFRAAAVTFCPDVPVIFMDARLPDVRRAAWSVADLFVSPVDNVQETFGLTPLEAMAAGLPVVVSDWNGYRETVRDGVDGFRIRTIAAPPGLSEDLALRFSEGGLDGYEAQVGAIGQSVAVDIDAMAGAIGRLAADPSLRRSMGRTAQTRARQDYDWSVVVPRHQALWGELAERRAAAISPPGTHPARPDPFHVFRGYPSEPLSPRHRAFPTGRDPGLVAELHDHPLVRFGQPAMPDAATLHALLAAVDGCTVKTLGGRFPNLAPREITRALLWLAKYGLITLRD